MDWYSRIPKVELHLHLEGAIPYDALWKLVQKYEGDVPSIDALERRFEYTDFPHFIETWAWKNQFLREYEDFTHIAGSVARDLVRQNICYAEVFFSPPDFFRYGLQTQRITEAVRKGFDQVPDAQITLVADLVRDYGPERGEYTLSELAEVKHLGIAGIGIGGNEAEYPPELFQGVFMRARKLGFRTSAHAGEAAGAESIWGAVRSLQVDRIGHGTRAEDDRALFDHIIENRIPVEMCPLSNVRTGTVGSYYEHPIRRYYEAGVVLSVNTDDPKMFGNSLAEEYRLLVDEKGFSPTEIKNLVVGAVEASWMADERKKNMKARIISDPAW